MGAVEEGKDHIRQDVLDRCEENKELWQMHYADGFDSENHNIAVCEYDQGDVKPSCCPDTFELIEFPELVSNEQLLGEVATYRSKARSLPSTILAPKAH